jgi:hypothetical protein
MPLSAKGLIQAVIADLPAAGVDDLADAGVGEALLSFAGKVLRLSHPFAKRRCVGLGLHHAPPGGGAGGSTLEAILSTPSPGLPARR